MFPPDASFAKRISDETIRRIEDYFWTHADAQRGEFEPTSRSALVAEAISERLKERFNNGLR